MKRSRLLIAFAVLALGRDISRQTVDTYQTASDSQTFLTGHQRGTAPVSPETAEQVRRLLARMTLEEKVGQMTQLEIGMVSDGLDADLQIDPAKLRKAVVTYGVGSLLNVRHLAFPIDKWHAILSAIQAAAGESRLKIPVLYGIDSIHGANYVTGATLFPQPLGMAATWNPELMLAASRISAAETRAAGIPWTFSPVLDIGRQPLWPRLYETFGEDVHLASVMGAATVSGYQGDDPASARQVAACLKHYIGYSFPTSGHDRTPALIPPATLREYFLPTFAAGVKAGALSVMVNSGEVNGIAGHANAFLLKDVLRGELGFDGVVVSDWEDIKKLVTMHHVAASEKDATRIAVLAGIDMSMVPEDYSFSDLLVQLVKEGAVPVSRIDEAVSRILTMKARLGLFDDPLRGITAPVAVGSPESRRVALEAARESIVLLKNTGPVLPLAPASRVLITGPAADSLPALNNGWTITWQGDRAAAYPKDRPSIRGAVEARLGAGRAAYVPGVGFDKEIDIAAAVAAARDVDVVVLCLGEGPYAETPGNIDDLALPDPQLRLAQALAAAGKPIVLVLVEGRPRLIRRIADATAGIVLALNPGMEGGTAVADVLFGDVNPSGRLPITYPRDANALAPYDHKWSENQKDASQPQFEFGFGLSYTTFEYRDLTIAQKGGASDPVSVSVTVRNTGHRSGADVVELFVSARSGSVTPAVKRLKRFERVMLEPGAARVMQFRLERDDFAFIGPDEKPHVEAGVFTISVGGLRGEVTLAAAGVAGHAQRMLTADGRQTAYAQIEGVLGTAPETPDCGHTAFGPHITQAFDRELGKSVFVFNLHVTPDNDRCSAVDRQRLEIKTDGRSPAYMKGFLDDTVTFRWLFKLPAGFQPSTNFTHIHQIKPFDGDASLPIITLTPRKGDPDRLELIHVDSHGVTTKIATARLEPFIGRWIEAYERITYGPHGRYSITLRGLRDDVPLLQYANDNLDLWRTGTTMVRPKWGIYRSLKTPADLRDEAVSFDRFCLAKGSDDCASEAGNRLD